MPADNTLPQAPTGVHGNASQPYPCHAAPEPPGSEPFIDYGYCRTSLDHQPPGARHGSKDPRCPHSCPHKAPERIAVQFTKVFAWNGARAAAKLAKTHRDRSGK